MLLLSHPCNKDDSGLVNKSVDIFFLKSNILEKGKAFGPDLLPREKQVRSSLTSLQLQNTSGTAFMGLKVPGRCRCQSGGRQPPLNCSQVCLD